MEVIYLAGAALPLLIISIYLYVHNKRLKDEVETVGSILDETIRDFERDLEDHRASERELSIVSAKLEGLKQTTLTPDNSIPKQVHVEKVMDLSNRLSATETMLEDVTKKFEDARGKAISERVRLGMVGETFAAFHEQFPYSRKDTKALFQPVDLICFEQDEIIFIDVKTGSSQLSKKQRNIRDNIKAGNVRFEVHRLDENGYQIKKES